jgi:hypothetical protein
VRMAKDRRAIMKSKRREMNTSHCGPLRRVLSKIQLTDVGRLRFADSPGSSLTRSDANP